MFIRIIRGLNAFAARLKAVAIKREENKLVSQAERIDAEIDLAEKRLNFSLQVQELLEERAVERLKKGVNKANAKKAASATKLGELAEL